MAVIPARGGSKRIPRKNIKPFCGRPMLAHTIERAQESALFDHILVSTDDPAIAEVAQAHGAGVPFTRPSELADDFCGLLDVMAHAVRFMDGEDWPLAAVCCLYATAPFLDPADLRRGAAELASGQWSYVFSATDFPAPIFRAFSAHPQGGVQMVFPEHFTTRSQDLPEALHDAAQFCWGTPAAFRARLPVFERHSLPVRIPRWRVQDIDTLEDWRRAEQIAHLLASSSAVL